MIRKLTVIFSLFIMMMFISACSSSDHGNQHSAGSLEVEFEMIPEIVQPGETVELQMIITHGDQPVVDAEEAVFEIWKHDTTEDHLMVEAEHIGDGVYSMEYTFDEEWVYYVYYHVTAVDVHRMKKYTIGVGDVDVDEIIETGHAGRTQWH